MRKAAIATTISVLLANVREVVVKRHERHMGGDIVKVTLRRVLFAPVNTFFDVTPIGKILKIFQEEINIFRDRMFHPLKRITDMSAHVVVVLSTMMLVGPWETIIALAIGAYIWRMIIPPFNAADNHFHKNVSVFVQSPIQSYFYECMSGTTVIRAFGQESSIMKKQHEILDKATINFIAHHSCWCWYNVRMFYSIQILPTLALILIAKNRLTYDKVALVMLYYWTTDMHWLMYILGSWTQFKRRMVEAQRVFNLQVVP